MNYRKSKTCELSTCSLRMREGGRVLPLPPRLIYRVHSENLSGNFLENDFFSFNFFLELHVCIHITHGQSWTFGRSARILICSSRGARSPDRSARVDNFMYNL